MTVQAFEITLSQAVRGPGSLDGETLVGIIVGPGYVFQVDHETAEDVNTWEVGTRVEGAATVTTDTDDKSVLVELDVSDEVDLTGDEVGRVCWFLDGSGDGERNFVGSNVDDTGSDNPAYTPTYPSGLYKLALTDEITITLDGGAP